MISQSELQRTGTILREAGMELYNTDFKGYHQLFLERRLNHIALRLGITKGSTLVDLLVNQPGIIEALKKEIHIGYTTFFRDPGFFLRAIELIRRKLDQQKIVHIWHAGCSKGYEVYSLVMLLHEQGLVRNCRIYATDINTAHLAQAEKGIVPIADLHAGIRPYLTAGGTHHIGQHFTATKNEAIFRHDLLRKIKFGHHDLGKDKPFQQFDFIFCRNVFIYYQPFYQKKLLQCISNSLMNEGYLGLSPTENIEENCAEFSLTCFDNHLNIYKKSEMCKTLLNKDKISI